MWQDGGLSKQEIVDFYGGGGDSTFKNLDGDGSGRVDMMEWFAYFARMTKKKGVQATSYKIKQLQRMAETIAMARRVVGM